ncbi:two-component system OmpR family response regulator [Chromohalobacter marismortui]|uniref:Two-component system OmpR family response regulator n=1 Tax=Chromohalobacter marismortui TaxID=42055 RepID=A0A4R7ND06_9GAMM|nr:MULTISPECIES: response regulator [Chromohalobacter]MCI0510996.1 response regulator [Chromohalobacter sp.]MCI0593459.1 response regulator [Chromohalobacter sp.]TDU18117.1 two-component system OmpR family response regulator [Chromohalobacter marismortui]
MTMNHTTVAVIDDDAEIRELLTVYLERHGFKVVAGEGGDALPALIRDEDPDLLILDIMMPGEDGLSLCRDLRRHSNLPIIMLTASVDETDRILGLELGADDYLAKPFNPRELLARIKAILRRAKPLPAAASRVVRFGRWSLDRITRELIDDEGNRSSLSGADYQLLGVFLEHPEQVLSRERLFDLSRGRRAPPLDRSIDVHVCRLRQRLGEDAQHSQLIRTVRGAGYVLATPVESGM